MAARRKTTRKNVPKSRAPAKKADGVLAVPGQLSGSWMERLEKYAKRDAATASGATGWPYIGTKNGVFRFNDDSFEELPPLLILGARFENALYSGDFDADNPNAPDCFAISQTEDDLAPPEALGDKRQCMQSEPSSEKCEGCWANAFGTAERGKGKACKNVRRLAVLPADRLDAKSLSEVEGAMLRIPVTSVKNYSTFANKVTKGLNIPLFLLRTSIAIEDDEKTQFKITFEPVDMADTKKGSVPLVIQDEDLLEVIEARVKEAETFLDQLPNLSSDADAPKQKAGKSRERRAASGPARKKVARKATRKQQPVRKNARKTGSRRAGGAKDKF